MSRYGVSGKPLRPVLKTRRKAQSVPSKGRAWATVEKALTKDVKDAARQGRGDAAFERFVRSALNSDTSRETGWVRRIRTIGARGLKRGKLS